MKRGNNLLAVLVAVIVISGFIMIGFAIDKAKVDAYESDKFDETTQMIQDLTEQVSNLTSEVSNMNGQVASLQTQLDDTKNQLVATKESFEILKKSFEKAGMVFP